MILARVVKRRDTVGNILLCVASAILNINKSKEKRRD